MKISSPNGDALDLQIEGYQFPELLDSEWDSNWLVIAFEACIGGRVWNARDPFLLTWEVALLIDWLDSLSRGERSAVQVDFLEPCIHFELQEGPSDRVKVRVYFELEARPSWAFATGAGMKNLWIDLDISPEHCREWAHDLRQQLQSFPMRADVDRPGGRAYRAHMQN